MTTTKTQPRAQKHPLRAFLKRWFFEHFGIFRRRKFKDFIAVGSIDVTFLILVFVLLTIGLVMMFSASYVNAWYTSKENDPYVFIRQQLLYAVLGVVLMFVVSKIKADVVKDASCLAMVIALLLLVYVLINPHIIPGKEEYHRWLEIPIVNISFQPSELAKIALVMFCAWSMERHQRLVEKKWWAPFPYLALIAVICVLVYKENHLSGTILIFLIGIVMTYLGGIKAGWYILGGMAVGAAVVYFVFNPDVLKEYAGERIVAWLDKDYDPQNARWQINQSLYAIGSGGMFGAGLGNSKQKHMYIPEPQNDFVFSIVCEELGFLGAVVIIVLFALLVCRGFMIALRAKDRFSSLLVMGICFQVGLQAALNIAVVTDTIPNTGIGLPFFSYGGTSLIILLVEMGMVLSVSRYSKIKK